MQNNYLENIMSVSKSWITNPRGQDDSYKREKKARLQKEEHNHSEAQDVYRVDLNLPIGKEKILKAEGDYDRGLLVKLLKDGGYEVAYWLEKPEPYPIEILIDGKSVSKNAKKISFRFHPELKKALPFYKENGGGGGGNGGGGGAATSGSFGNGGGTVFTSTNSGIFSPTYGGGGRRKKKRKKNAGVQRLSEWIRDHSPERKMVKSFVLDFNKWVSKKVHQQTSGEDINPQTKEIEGKRNPVEFDAKPSETADMEQKDMEQKIKLLDDKNDSRDSRHKDSGNASIAAPAGLEVQLATTWESGGYTSDSLKQGSDKDKEQGDVEELDDSDDKPKLVKMIGEDTYKKLGL